jgi:methyl-accepting chemotaxis protein
MRMLGDGNLTARVRLRKYDALSDVQDTFNHMATMLQSKIQKIEHLTKEARHIQDIQDEIKHQFKL